MWLVKRRQEGEMKEGKSLEIDMKQKMDGRKEKDTWRREKERIIETLRRNVVQKNLHLWHRRKVLSGWIVWVNCQCWTSHQIQIITGFQPALDKPRLSHKQILLLWKEGNGVWAKTLRVSNGSSEQRLLKL